MSRSSTVIRPTVKSTVFVISALSAAIIGSPVAFAAAQKNDGKKLETVYVSATRSETAQLPVATQIKVISAEEIRVSGAKLLSEVLRTQAGIQLTDSDGSGARNVTASMRGLSGTNNVLVLVDGRKLNNPSLAAPALNTVSLKDVERIEIVQGSAGVLYGDQAVGGVINIITRRAVAGEVDGVVSAARGSDDLEDYTANVRQGFENGLSYSVSAQKRAADNYRDNNDTAYENVLASVRYDSGYGFVFADGQQVKDELRLPGSISDAQAAIDRHRTNSPNDYSNQDTDTWRFGGGVNLSEHWQLLTEYSDRNEEGIYFYDDYWGGATPSPTEYSVRVKSLTPRVIGEYKTANGTAIATLGYDHIDSDYESNNIWKPVNSNQEQRSYYAQLVYPLLSRLTATIGTRQSEVEDQNYLKNKVQEDDLNASEFGLSYQFTDAWRGYGRFAESFRFGNADENNAVLFDVVFLKPQTGESAELGVEWQGTDAHVSYALYKMRLNDEIVYDSINYANINLPDSERQGFTLDVDTRLSDELALRFNYTYTDAEVVEGTYDGKQVPFVAENSAAFTVLFTPVSPLTFSLESVYTGSRYKGDDENNAQAKLDPLTVFNLAAVYNYRQLELSARLNNITNELYAGYHSVWGQYPQPERNGQVSVTYRF
ncbi:TonB-dependent receptor plug domain-containing protein [Cellvibrio mixtus]|uniref:TonB-dependent receptor plug domain-containing protein n=1 Tax=Cellvibrio mixtus TaxID=39650 RepID=UPI000587E7FC|nr:TonB-dependent receptor [Cellvibrio mixtus]